MLDHILDKKWCGFDVVCKNYDNRPIIKESQRRKNNVNIIDQFENECTYEETEDKLDIYYDNVCKYTITKTDEGYFLDKKRWDRLLFYS